MAGKLPKSQTPKRSQFRTDAEFCAALCRQRPNETQRAFINRCKRADLYEKRRTA